MELKIKRRYLNKMKTKKWANLGLSISLSLMFIHFLLSETLVSLIGLASVIGLIVEFYYFLNFFKAK